MAGNVAHEWYVNTDIHIVRKTDYKGSKQKHHLNLAFDALTMPGLLFVVPRPTRLAGNAPLILKLRRTHRKKHAFHNRGMLSSTDSQLFGRATEEHRYQPEDVSGKLLSC